MIVYFGAFVAALLGLWLLPKEETSLRKIALFLSYGFGLPIVVGAGTQVLRKVGVWNGK
ncbi:MAG TPA: hypothetical protein VK178_14025 [Opitutaceae bacterium]|nr:hypothetical protein [Opitutaceae bacterium]